MPALPPRCGSSLLLLGVAALQWCSWAAAAVLLQTHELPASSGLKTRLDASDRVHAIAIVNETSDVLIGGQISNSFCGLPHVGTGTTDGLISKYDSGGRQLWVATVGTAGADGVNGVAADHATNSAFAAGFSGDQAWLAKYDLRTGARAFKTRVGQPTIGYSAVATGVALVPFSDTAFVVGFWQESGYTNGQCFLSRVSMTSGALLSEATFGTGGRDRCAVESMPAPAAGAERVVVGGAADASAAQAQTRLHKNTPACARVPRRWLSPCAVLWLC